MEEKLITLIIGRLFQELPINKGKIDFRKEESTLQNEKALIELSPYKLNFLVHGLLQISDKIFKSNQTPELISKSHIIVLELIVNCLSYQWDNIRAQFSNLADVKDELERIRIKEKEEAILPPPLEDRVSKELFKLLYHFVSKPQPCFQTELQDIAAKGLYQISASNFETIITSVTQYLSPNISCSEEEIISQITLLEYFNFNAKHLSDFMSKLSKVLPSFKKLSIQICIASVLRKIIWNWINRYPFEFVTLCQSGTRTVGNPELLFDVFDSWATSTSKKINFWPVCTMLLILCPDILLRVVMGNGQTQRKEDGSKEAFLQHLFKSLQNSKLADIATVCYIDIWKASTFVSKSDLSALRFIIPAVESELKEKIFPPTPRIQGEGLIDERLIVEFLHSAFLLSPRKAMNSIFIDCLKGSSFYKRSLVKTLLRIGSQHNLPWNPTLYDVYSLHSGNLRALFQELLSSVRDYSALANLNDKKSKQQMEKVTLDLDILEKLITLYKVDPMVSFYPSKTPNLEEIRLLFLGLCDCAALFHLPTLAEKAYDTLLELHKPEYIGSWFPPNIVEGFWLISSSVNAYIATILTDQLDLEQSQILRLFYLLEQILKRKNQFIERYKDAQPADSTKRHRSQASIKLEIAMLIHFCSGNTEIVSRSANCLTLLCAELDLVRQSVDDTDNALLMNFDAYKRLGNAGILSTGRQAQQKAIRTALKRVDRPSAGNYAAWEAVYQRWQMYTAVLLINEENASDSRQMEKKKEEARRKGINRTIIEKSHADILQEWNNFVGFLCSSAAVTLQETKSKNNSRSDHILEIFINDLMEHLVSDFLSVREVVKMALGNTLSPPALPVLFQVLNSHAKNIFGKDGQGNFSTNSILFVDQSVSILKLIIDGDLTNDNLSLFTSDFEDLIITLTRFVRQLTISVNSLQTKLKVCGSLEGIMGKIGLLTFRNEYKFRTTIIENIIEWTSEFSTKESNIPQDLPFATHKQIVKLIKELDVQVLQAISALIRGLPLQGKDDEEKSIAFSKLFSFFTNLLTRCKKNPQSVLSPQLPEATIQSLSYLVTANIEHGLEYFVTMGYHEDYETRSAFLKVLTNILNEGTEFDITTSINKYYKFNELILEPNLEVVLSLCEITPITEADAIAQLLIRIFESQEKTMDLLKQSIIQEVAKTESASTLFRRNSMATKLMAAYCKLIGQQYLKFTLGPLMRDLQQSPLTSELNPTTLPAGQDLETNQKNIQKICTQFLEAIIVSIPQCFQPFREICNFLKSVVSHKFPEAERTAVAGFIFLRFLCPAIVAPEGFGVISNDLQDKELRRCLVLVTKVLQNLANQVYFVKEPYMECMNGFIESNLPLMNKILDEYSTLSEGMPTPPPISFSEEQINEDIGRLHYFITISIDRLSNLWSVSGQKSNTFDKLTSILSQLGPPPEPSMKSLPSYTLPSSALNNAKNQNIHYHQFLNRMSKLDTDNPKFKDIFYAQGKSKKGHPVVYYIARNFTADLDSEHLFFYMLKTSQQLINQPYSIVVDLSMFSLENQIQIPWCSTFAKIFPDFGASNLDTIYIINANNWFKKYSNRMGKFVSSRQQKKVLFIPSVVKLFDYISESECGLPPDTLTVESNVQSTFSHVIKEGKYSKKEVTVRISADLLQVITIKQYSIFNHATSLIDLIHVSAIIDVTAVKENQFVVKYNVSGNTRSLLLNSAATEQILQQLNASLDGYRLLHQSSQPKRGGKAFRPSDVPGTLLNMALLNLTVNSHSLRIAAYNLLVSLCSSFQFSIPSHFLEATDIAIPRNRRHFVIRISSELAEAQPGLSLEFLLESLHSLSKADYRSKVMVLDYLKPWMVNLQLYTQPAASSESSLKFSKAKEILDGLLEISISDDQLAPALLTKIWKVIGGLEKLIDVTLSCVYEKCFALKNPLGSKPLDAIEDVMITLASRNRQLIAGKIIHLILNLLNDPSNQNIDRMENNPIVWVKMEVIIRFLLVLSNENLICVEMYLPELFYIITIFFFSGNSLFRTNVHALFMNIVHSIFSSRICHEEKLQTLRFHINDFQQLQNRLHFGVGNNDLSPFDKSNINEKIEVMPIAMVENVTTSLLNVLNCCTKNASSFETPRHARWLSLTMLGAFTPNLNVQPRAISALGILCRSPSFATDDLFIHLISLLKSSLITYSIKDGQGGTPEDMPTSVINCLSRLYEFLDVSSPHYKSLFWITTSLLCLHDVKIFASAATLMETIIHTMADHNVFKGQGLSSYLLDARKGMMFPMLKKLDQINGISFEHNFSFSIAGHLLKGLKFPSTKAITTRVLASFVNLCRESKASNMLGYLSALLPIKGDDFGNLNLTIMAASGEAGNSQTLFNAAMVPDQTHACLLFTFLVTILKNSEFEHEQQYIYKSLVEGVSFLPDAFPLTFEVLIPKMQQVLNSSHVNTNILESILAINHEIFKNGLDCNGNYSQISHQYLQTIGFPGLPENDVFMIHGAARNSHKAAVIPVICAAIDASIIL